jgi:hypothetical protein
MGMSNSANPPSPGNRQASRHASRRAKAAPSPPHRRVIHTRRSIILESAGSTSALSIHRLSRPFSRQNLNCRNENSNILPSVAETSGQSLKLLPSDFEVCESSMHVKATYVQMTKPAMHTLRRVTAESEPEADQSRKKAKVRSIRPPEAQRQPPSIRENRLLNGFAAPGAGSSSA